MIFKVGNLKVTAPLDSLEGKRYIEWIRGTDMENLYNLNSWMGDYVDPLTNGVISWRSSSACASDSEAGLDNW